MAKEFHFDMYGPPDILTMEVETSSQIRLKNTMGNGLVLAQLLMRELWNGTFPTYSM